MFHALYAKCRMQAFHRNSYWLTHGADSIAYSFRLLHPKTMHKMAALIMKLATQDEHTAQEQV